MPWGLYRTQHTGHLHFLTFSCLGRKSLLGSEGARATFERSLERMRDRYGFLVMGYVVMPEHVHLLVSEPPEAELATAIQAIKLSVVRELRKGRFWLERYYDFVVLSERKKAEKLRYIHRNPVARGLVVRPEDWAWSSFRHYQSGVAGTVEIESWWTDQRRRGLDPVPGL